MFCIVISKLFFFFHGIRQQEQTQLREEEERGKDLIQRKSFLPGN